MSAPTTAPVIISALALQERVSHPPRPIQYPAAAPRVAPTAAPTRPFGVELSVIVELCMLRSAPSFVARRTVNPNRNGAAFFDVADLSPMGAETWASTVLKPNTSDSERTTTRQTRNGII